MEELAFVLTIYGIWKAGEKITNKIKEKYNNGK